MKLFINHSLCSILTCLILIGCVPYDKNKSSSEAIKIKSSSESGLINMAQNGCASWQAIRLTGSELMLLNEILERNHYSTKHLEYYNMLPTIIYIKTLDIDFMDYQRNTRDSNLEVDVNFYDPEKNRFDRRLINNNFFDSEYVRFNSTIYGYIENNINRVNIKDLNELIDDRHAQSILKLDTVGVNELYYFLGDTTFSQSYDTSMGRQLSVGDLANSLLMIVYGQDYWNDKVYPAPVDRLNDLKFEQLISPPEWYSLSSDKKNEAIRSEEYLKFISRGWRMSVSDITLRTTISNKDYGWQTPEWIESILEIYPDENKSYILENHVNPIEYKSKTLKSLKFKLTSALENSENVLVTCD